MKKLLFLCLCASLTLCCTSSVTAQRVTKLKALKGFEGNTGDWGVSRNGMVMPAKGFAFFEVDEALIIFVPNAEATVSQVVNTIKQSKSFQLAVFGESYETFKKKKKKKKPKPSIKVVCKSKSNCNYSCYAILDSDGQFIRCGGQCCEAGEGVWGSSNVGAAAETVSM